MESGSRGLLSFFWGQSEKEVFVIGKSRCQLLDAAVTVDDHLWINFLSP
jgi:hypothetical protein